MALPSLPTLSRYDFSCEDPKHQFEVHNPATGKILTTVQGGNASTTREAIKKSQLAFEKWSQLPASERANFLHKCGDVLIAHKEELATLLCLENGKPQQDALSFDAMFCSQVFHYFASIIDKLPSEFYDRGAMLVSVVREPHGVCAGILPFNWPPIHTAGKTAPCLAAGNTMILKPGEQAPLTVMRIVELLQSVLPEDVVQAVPGLGPEVPQTLVTAPAVKMVSFTGATKTGAIIAKSASEQVKPLALELGGKNIIVVFDDADIDRAVGDALQGGFFNKGEACTAASRIIVQELLYDKFVAQLAQAVKKLRSGNGMDKATHVGPCVTQAQQKRVLNYIETGKKEGARLVVQAPLPSDPECREGFFVAPTLFADVTPSMTIAQDEIFGPVVTIGKFHTEDEAVSVANSVAYGLVASVFTGDMERGLRVCRRLQAGMVLFNNYQRNVLGLPFGGVKDSGYGREHSIGTLEEWTRKKFIQMPSGRGQIMSWRAVGDCIDSEPH